ncbi:hypothetical protein R3P38DRAFT_3168000 [Favolaschia claudopus]|uniref:Uncharacterized protein n=1 Tax=Favolaschia claudopus TaxID=2862362 RepID=A0AAW0E3Y9_9AGAR
MEFTSSFDFSTFGLNNNTTSLYPANSTSPISRASFSTSSPSCASIRKWLIIHTCCGALRTHRALSCPAAPYHLVCDPFPLRQAVLVTAICPRARLERYSGVLDSKFFFSFIAVAGGLWMESDNTMKENLSPRISMTNSPSAFYTTQTIIGSHASTLMLYLCVYVHSFTLFHPTPVPTCSHVTAFATFLVL